MEEETKAKARLRKTQAMGLMGVIAFFCVTVVTANELNPAKIKELSLSGKRSQALDLIKTELQRKNLAESQRQNLLQLLDKIANLFYGAQALQAYELARSQEINDPEASIKTYQNVISLEPENIKAPLALSRILLTRGECKESLKWAEAVLEQHPVHKRAFYFKAFALACLGRVEELLSMLNADPQAGADDYMRLSLAQAYLVEEDWEPAKEWLNKVKNRKIPEFHYFYGTWLRAQQLPEHRVSFARYVDLCGDKKADPDAIDPRQCLQVAEVRKKYELLSGESIPKEVQ